MMMMEFESRVTVDGNWLIGASEVAELLNDRVNGIYIVRIPVVKTSERGL